MRNNILLSALLIICLSVAAVADENTSASADSPFIFINTNSPYGYIVATNSQYSSFAQIARSMGFDIDHGILNGLTDENLEDVDILVLPAPGFTLLDEDKEALRRFLQRGGGLFFMAAHRNWVDLSNYDSFLGEFGITFGISEWGTVKATVPPGCTLSSPYPCYQIVNNLGTSKAYLVTDPSKTEIVAIRPNGNILGAVSTNRRLLGLGRMVVFAGIGVVSNNALAQYDNTNLAKNILTYLLGGPDLRATLCKFKGRNISPGSIVKLIAKVRNDGNEASEATIVRFFLCTTNTYNGSPPEVVATLGSADLPALNPGKSKKVKVKVSIPPTVTPGDYYVIAVADPEGETSDSNTSNNYKASKKQMTIN